MAKTLFDLFAAGKFKLDELPDGLEVFFESRRSDHTDDEVITYQEALILKRLKKNPIAGKPRRGEKLYFNHLQGLALISQQQDGNYSITGFAERARYTPVRFIEG